MKLGIDGKYLNGEDEIFVLGEVEDKEFLGITKDNQQSHLIERLELLRNSGKTVCVVNMDMDKRIKGAVRKVFPEERGIETSSRGTENRGTAIVADKFHIFKHVNKVIDLCRIAIEKSVNERFQIKRTLLMKTETFQKIKQELKQKELEEERTSTNQQKWKTRIERFEQVLQTHKEIQVLWDLKNKIHGFYRCTSLRTAKISWEKILTFLSKHEDIHPEFRDLQNTFKNWEAEILNYFIYRTTNAYIEGLNNRIETFKRRKWGFRKIENFLKALCYMLFPISDFFPKVILDHLF